MARWPGMAPMRNVAVLATCVVLCGAAIVWHAQKRKAAERQFAEVVKSYRARAESGDAKAQYQLGASLRTGRGVQRDDAEAVRWLRRSAEQGYAEGQYGLAYVYHEGRGVPQDNTSAADWSRRAADQGLASAQSFLAAAYAIGRGVPQDYTQAMHWYFAAASRSDATGQCGVGYMYRNGLGVPRDYIEALRWYRKAADQGSAMGQFDTGDMYYHGLGVSRDYSQAAHWWLKASDQGDTHARRDLLSLYCTAKGTPIARWTGILVLSLGLTLLVVPSGGWARPWLPTAFCSADCALMLIHELSLSELSLPALALGPLGPLWRGLGHIIWLAFFAVCSIGFALAAIQVAHNKIALEQSAGKQTAACHVEIFAMGRARRLLAWIFAISAILCFWFARSLILVILHGPHVLTLRIVFIAAIFPAQAAIYLMAWWTVWKRKLAAKRWGITASLTYIPISLWRGIDAWPSVPDSV
jgi:TPR repeat protein